MREAIGKAKPVHPYKWLWEPLEEDPGFLLRPMFGGKAAYLDGKLVLYFVARKDPWRGLLVATERDQHPSLLKDFPALKLHKILPKWLYLSESEDRFETLAQRLVALAKRRDPRIGIVPSPKKRYKKRRSP